MAEIAVYQRLESRWFDFQNEHARFRRNLAQMFTKEHVGLYYFGMYLLLLVELVGSLVALPMCWNQGCDGGLHVWLGGYIVRTCCWIPLMVHEQKIHFYQGSNNAELARHLHNNTKWQRLLRIASMIWFVLGSVLLFSGSTCSQTAPVLFYTCATWVALGYLSLLTPVFSYVTIVFCFPFLLTFFQRLAERAATSPELEACIQGLPTKAFTEGLVPADKATCVICSDDYRKNASIRFLPCAHHFHKGCSDTWLRLKATCPLCVRPIDDSPQPLLTPQQQSQQQEAEELQVHLAQITQESQV